MQPLLWQKVAECQQSFFALFGRHILLGVHRASASIVCDPILVIRCSDAMAIEIRHLSTRHAHDCICELSLAGTKYRYWYVIEWATTKDLIRRLCRIYLPNIARNLLGKQILPNLHATPNIKTEYRHPYRQTSRRHLY
jgi:hypothetical protein